MFERENERVRAGACRPEKLTKALGHGREHAKLRRQDTLDVARDIGTVQIELSDLAVVTAHAVP